MSVKVSEKEKGIREFLRDNGMSYGLDMIEAGLGQEGAIYNQLSSMVDAKLITRWPGRYIKNKPSRPFFTIAIAGREVLDDLST